MNSRSPDALARVAGLSIWSAPVEPEPITGGITNTNFAVRDGGRRYFVRIGEDIPVHGVMRFNELAAARAAEAAGISPAVVHAEPGVLVTEFIEGATLDEETLRDEAMLRRVVPLVRQCHEEVARQVSAPILMFWAFHIVRHYGQVLRSGASRYASRLSDLIDRAGQLEEAVGHVRLVFGHNDLLPANFIDDGHRLWLVDWDYAGFNSPLFDLGGLAANSQLSPGQEAFVLEQYFGAEPDAGLWRGYRAMKAASALREAMWSMVSELHSTLDFDFEAYTADNLGRFEAAWSEFKTN
jgi:thiamine kinase-like enzyme